MEPHIQKKTNEEIFEAIQMLASQMDQRFEEVNQRFEAIEQELREAKKEFQEYTKKTDERFADVYDLIRPLHRRALENYRAPY